ncbi:MAG: hypothetical protein EXS11_05015 [Gemmataceae bacterium]|nr:hypothetical protein [Gemmataceae bacterium]
MPRIDSPGQAGHKTPSPKPQRVELIKVDHMISTDFENLFGKEYLQGLLKRELRGAIQEAKVMLSQAVKE